MATAFTVADQETSRLVRAAWIETKRIQVSSCRQHRRGSYEPRGLKQPTIQIKPLEKRRGSYEPRGLKPDPGATVLLHYRRGSYEPRGLKPEPPRHSRNELLVAARTSRVD